MGRRRAAYADVVSGYAALRGGRGTRYGSRPLGGAADQPIARYFGSRLNSDVDQK